MVAPPPRKHRCPHARSGTGGLDGLGGCCRWVEDRGSSSGELGLEEAAAAVNRERREAAALNRERREQDWEGGCVRGGGHGWRFRFL